MLSYALASSRVNLREIVDEMNLTLKYKRENQNDSLRCLFVSLFCFSILAFLAF